jgi:CheY-like chemotaxis protein
MQAIGTLAGGIAHDFNNILLGIIGYAELAIPDVAEPDKTVERLKRILSASARAKELTRQILMFSRQTEQKLETVQLHAILEETLRLIRASTPATIRIENKTSAATGAILADPSQIHQIIMNLCANAVHAMGGEVGVLTAKLASVDLDSGTALQTAGLPPGQYALLTIGDTGHGMTPAVSDRIFDPFFTTKENSGGTGMGLSVVHGIVTRLHGAITVKSELGKGTAFQVYFPAAEKRPILPALPKAVLPTGSERILLIDDEETIVDVAGQTLRGLGYRVVTETVSRSALWTYLKNPFAFDLVISDQTMPGMKGTEMYKKIRSIRPELPFILSTGFSETVTRESALAMGIRELIMKPYLKEELAAAVRNALDHPVENTAC